VAASQVPRDTDAILDLLRAGGGRATASRRATIDVILAAGDEHLAAGEILRRVRTTVPDVAESTVYRILASLEDLGVISHLHLANGASAYHPAGARHQHLVCRRCGAVTDVPDTVFDELATVIDAFYGFSIDASHVALQGHCSACRTAAATTP
jgi:Fur family ferric uptake transcriptional regulator